MSPNIEAWDPGFRTLAKIAKWYPQSAYSGLGMLIYIEWKYLQRTVSGFSSLMDPIHYALIEAFFPALLGREKVSADLKEILGYSVKHVGLGIPDPGLSEEHTYNTSKAASEVLVGSLLGGNNLNHVSHKGCVRRASADGRKQ